jgi:hypothetical protein
METYGGQGYKKHGCTSRRQKSMETSGEEGRNKHGNRWEGGRVREREV